MGRSDDPSAFVPAPPWSAWIATCSSCAALHGVCRSAISCKPRSGFKSATVACSAPAVQRRTIVVQLPDGRRHAIRCQRPRKLTDAGPIYSRFAGPSSQASGLASQSLLCAIKNPVARTSAKRRGRNREEANVCREGPRKKGIRQSSISEEKAVKTSDAQRPLRLALVFDHTKSIGGVQQIVKKYLVSTWAIFLARKRS